MRSTSACLKLLPRHIVPSCSWKVVKSKSLQGPSQEALQDLGPERQKIDFTRPYDVNLRWIRALKEHSVRWHWLQIWSVWHQGLSDSLSSFLFQKTSSAKQHIALIAAADCPRSQWAAPCSKHKNWSHNWQNAGSSYYMPPGSSSNGTQHWAQ